MEVKVIRCPNCGADVDYDMSRDMMFCSYCGTKIALERHSTHTEIIVDEARLKELEMEKKREAEEKPQRIIGLIAKLIIWVMLMVFFLYKATVKTPGWHSHGEYLFFWVCAIITAIIGAIVLFPRRRK